MNNQKYDEHYSEDNFWNKVKNNALKVGKDLLEKALILYYCLIDPDTPGWAKAVIVSALGYFILPLDLIPDITPIAGYADDLGALAAALASVIAHVKEEHRNKAEETIAKLFG